MSSSRTTRLLAGLTVSFLLALTGPGETGAQGVGVRSDDDSPSTVYVSPGPGHVAYLGIQLEEETDHPEGGARVTEVVEDSPAEKAGIQAGDIIVNFDGKTIRGPVSLTQQIHDRDPGERVSVTLVRDGREKQLTVELGDRAEKWSVYSVAPLGRLDIVVPDIDGGVQERLLRGVEKLSAPGVYSLGNCEDDEEDCGISGLGKSFRWFWSSRPSLGVELVETTTELNEHLGSRDGNGVLVSKVLRGMPAEHAGILVGDLIVSVEGEPVGNVTDLRRLLREHAGNRLTIDVIRDDSPRSIEVTLPEVEEDETTGPRAYRLQAPRAPRPPRHVRAVPAAPAPAQVPASPEAPARPAPPAPPTREVVVLTRWEAREAMALARAGGSSASCGHHGPSVI